MMRRGAPLVGCPPIRFGFHSNKFLRTVGTNNTPDHDLGYGFVRIWDVFATWKQIERFSKGSYDWSRLDQVVAGHRAAGRRMMYTFAQVPDWANGQPPSGFYDYGPVPPTNLQDFTDFAVALAERNRDVYGTAIEIFELWNEPDSLSQAYWSGTMQLLIDMIGPAATAIKAVSPDAKIMSPSIVAGGWDWLDAYARAGGLSFCDLVGYHAYPSPSQPERAAVYTSRAQAILDCHGITKPLWCTELGILAYVDESGVFHDNLAHHTAGEPYEYAADHLAVSYIVRANLAMLASGAASVIWYSMDAPVMIVQVTDVEDCDILLPAGYAYRYMADLLRGGGVSKLRRAGSLWKLRFLSGDGRWGAVMWTADYKTEVVDLSAYASGTDALGNPITLTSSYGLTMAPIYCFSG